MTTTITKRADELKPGDIVIGCAIGNQAMKSTVVWADELGTDFLKIMFVRLGAQHAERRTSIEDHANAAEFMVGAPALTPAQQHAEELAEVARLFLSSRLRGLQNNTEGLVAVERMKEVVAKIDPPSPPTLEEALQMLQTVMEKQSNTPEAEAFLDGARRAGILK